jgi:regulator of protease activity HflC (stomatin/prohibitin superfamily)
VFERHEVARQLTAGLAPLDAIGVRIEDLQLRDVVLPADLKRAQAQVLLARAEGEAALERARGETTALRALANAARLTADNPSLHHLRVLQQLAATSGHTVVIGSPPLGAPMSPT